MKRTLATLILASFFLLFAWEQEASWTKTTVYAAEVGDYNNANCISSVNVLMSPKNGVYTVDGNSVFLIDWDTTDRKATKTKVELSFDINRITEPPPMRKKEEPEISGETKSPFMNYRDFIDRYRFTIETRQIDRRRFFQTYGKAFIVPWFNKPIKTIRVKYHSATIDITSCCSEARNGTIPVFFEELVHKTCSSPALGLVSLKTGDLQKIGYWKTEYPCENNGSIAWLNDYQLAFIGVAVDTRYWGIFDLRLRKTVAGGKLKYQVNAPDEVNDSYMQDFFINDGTLYGIQRNDDVRILYQSEKQTLH